MDIVTAAVIRDDTKVLIARRNKDKHLGGKWEFPGGKLEPNETPEQCLERELLEELSIKVNVREFICSNKFVYEHTAIELLAFNVQYISGDFRLVDHDKLQWVSIQELENFDFSDADKPIINKLMESPNA